MSEFFKIVQQADVKVVLPYAGKLSFIPVANNRDKALCFTVTLGYFEVSSLEVCNMLRFYVDNSTDTSFRCIGNIDEVWDDEKRVYRQRFRFSNLLLLMRFIRRLNIKLVISESFDIGVSQLSSNVAVIPILDKYLRLYNRGVDLGEWLTLSCIMYVKKLSEIYGVSFECQRRVNPRLLRNIFNRSPYLCGVLNTTNVSKSGVVILHSDCLTVKYEDECIPLAEFDGYRCKSEEGAIDFFGYTEKNVTKDYLSGRLE